MFLDQEMTKNTLISRDTTQYNLYILNYLQTLDSKSN